MRWSPDDMDQLRAALSFLRSFLRRDWALEDYLVKVIERAPHQLVPLGRLKPSPWTAQLINWWFMRGDGDTREEAVAQLRQSFEAFKANNPKLPRPGLGLPPKIQFAPTEKIESYDAIVEDLMMRVVGFEPGSYLITDESSLWDFHEEESNESYFRKIAILYGVDVSDIEPPRIATIAQRIHESRSA